MNKHLRYFALVAAATLATACDSSAPDTFMVPQFDGVSGSSGSSDITIVRTKETKTKTRADGIIGPQGGSISSGGHTLVVPAGAVNAPTQFMLQVKETNAIHVDLKAWRVIDGAPVTQFPVVPVQIRLSVGDVTDVDPARLIVVYLRDGTYDGRKDVMRSSYNATARTVTGVIPHFSEYTVGIDRSGNSGSGSYNSGSDSGSGSNSGSSSGYY